MTNTGLLGLLLQFIPPGLAATPPGGTDYPQELSRRLDAALRDKGPDYRPRTEHLRPDGSPEFSNRLLLESSPYLLQHAHNPVDWYPWGAEAFARARAEGKPVFLSIGYSTCHWCHVMEKESFENLEIAAYLNRHFIAIKVDRERRPDVDANYMTAIQLIRGNGGWPASSFLTPEGKPFYGGTYYPPGQFLGRNGDCEDYAIARFMSLRALGFDDRLLRIVVLGDLTPLLAHAVLVVYYQGEALVLDNQIESVLPASAIRHYRPIYSLNEHNWWLHRY